MEEEAKSKHFPPYDEATSYEVPRSYENPVPLWLKASYIILVIWGIITGYIFINGTVGWLDRGYWKQLQIAANTTFPQTNHLVMPKDQQTNAEELTERKSSSHSVSIGIQ